MRPAKVSPMVGRRPFRPGVALSVALLITSIPSGSSAHGEQPEAWSSFYEGTDWGSDIPFDVVAAPDGERVYVTGWNDQRMTTIAYDAWSGADLWTDGSQSFRPSPIGRGRALATSPDGSHVYVTGPSPNPERSAIDGTANDDYVLVAYDAATGDRIWTARHEAGRADVPLSLALSADGSLIVVAGYMWTYEEDADLLVVAFDSATGAERWSARYAGPEGGNDYGVSVVTGPAGGAVFVAGERWGPHGFDLLLLALDPDSGNLLWEGCYDGGGDERTVGMVLAPDGSRAYVTASRFDKAYSASTVAFDSVSGDVVWAARHTIEDGSARPSSLVVSPDGAQLFVSMDLGRVAVIAYDATSGQPAWQAEIPGGGTVREIAVTADGATLFAGGTRDWDVMAAALRANDGMTLWSATHDGPIGGFDYGTGVATSPDGTHAFVIGAVDVNDGFLTVEMREYLTIAYGPTCRSGASLNGPISGATREHVEPQAGPARSPIREAACVLGAHGP